MTTLEEITRTIEAALHQKLFAMNGYRKLPASLEKQSEVAEEVARAVLETHVKPMLAEAYAEAMGTVARVGADTDYAARIIAQLTEQSHDH